MHPPGAFGRAELDLFDQQRQIDTKLLCGFDSTPWNRISQTLNRPRKRRTGQLPQFNHFGSLTAGVLQVNVLQVNNESSGVDLPRVVSRGGSSAKFPGTMPCGLDISSLPLNKCHAAVTSVSSSSWSFWL